MSVVHTNGNECSYSRYKIKSKDPSIRLKFDLTLGLFRLKLVSLVSMLPIRRKILIKNLYVICIYIDGYGYEYHTCFFVNKRLLPGMLIGMLLDAYSSCVLSSFL